MGQCGALLGLSWVRPGFARGAVAPNCRMLSLCCSPENLSLLWGLHSDQLSSPNPLLGPQLDQYVIFPFPGTGVILEWCLLKGEDSNFLLPSLALPQCSPLIFKVPGLKLHRLLRTHEIRFLKFSKPNVMEIFLLQVGPLCLGCLMYLGVFGVSLSFPSLLLQHPSHL